MCSSSEGGGCESNRGVEIHLFSWLDEELEGLEESLDALRGNYGPYQQYLPTFEAPPPSLQPSILLVCNDNIH